MNEPIKCYICHRSGVNLFWINGLQEFMCWHCIAAAVVVLARETAPSNNAVHLTPAAAGSRDDNDTEPQAQATNSSGRCARCGQHS